MKKITKKTKQKLLSLWISICLVIVLLMVWSSSVWLPNLLIPSISTFTVSKDMQKLFFEQFSSNADINSAITIYVDSFYDEPSNTQVGELVNYTVFNHTEEKISFKNNGFGLRIFTPNEGTGEWEELIPIIHPGETPTMLGAKVESIGRQTDTLFYPVEYSDFNGELPSKLRIFVTGTGTVSKKIYVAYVDLLRKIK
jgi:hypothetical protein